MTVNHLVAGSSPAEAAKVYGGEESMVIQRTVNPPPLARLVRSQYSPPDCCIECNNGLRILGRQQRRWPSRLHNEPHIFKESIMKKKNTPQPRNYLVKLALFRKAGSHRKSNKAVRRTEKSKRLYPIVDNSILISV